MLFDTYWYENGEFILFWTDWPIRLDPPEGLRRVATDVRRPLWESLSTRIWAEPFFLVEGWLGWPAHGNEPDGFQTIGFAYANELLGLRVAQNYYILLVQTGPMVPKPMYLLVQMFTVFLNLIKTSLKVSILVRQVRKSRYFECQKHMRLSNHCFCLSKSRSPQSGPPL